MRVFCRMYMSTLLTFLENLWNFIQLGTNSSGAGLRNYTKPSANVENAAFAILLLVDFAQAHTPPEWQN
ncbi:unnamed protein product [Allacma fusca]|uniref:Uncharacterized protein n=1 Tax=Allacma fusca TaxID=39272 RepID=A0A8J2NWL1_9HEXA|nr:unnamed protein product [Allacma fusca]